ncbi:MAG: leucyl aminopeptidase [Thermoanaerobaculia bacterium]
MTRQLVQVELAQGRSIAGEKLVLGVFLDAEPEYARLGADGAHVARELARSLAFRGEDGRRLEAPLRGKGRSLTLVGLGKTAKFTAEAAQAFVTKAIAAAEIVRAPSLGIVIPEHEQFRGAAMAEQVARRLALADYRFDEYLGKSTRVRLRRVAIGVPAAWRRTYSSGCALGRAIAEGVSLARDLGNSPPNQATPEWMARQARLLARRWKARVRVLDVPELKRRKMGGLLAVGGGSTHPPRMVRIELGTRGPIVALIGKGVTFDTGGISIKPAAQMDEMKWDKMGACGVLGILETASRLDLPVRLRAYLPFAENMPDGDAYRPGDIVRCANGKTVEITNTDAEGRMILADALSWAASEQPDAMLEYSTLTGACVVALGPTGAGLFTPAQDLADGLLSAAADSGERLWRLPLWPEFLDEMRGGHADLKNSGSRWGGASTAAAFLSQFVGEVAKWAHLDIAGPAYVGGDNRRKRGATGFGVALTIHWLLQQRLATRVTEGPKRSPARVPPRRPRTPPAKRGARSPR